VCLLLAVSATVNIYRGWSRENVALNLLAMHVLNEIIRGFMYCCIMLSYHVCYTHIYIVRIDSIIDYKVNYMK